MAYGAGAAGAAGAGYAKKISDTLTKAAVEIVSSSDFNKEEITQRKLKLAQAYALLWQDSEKGKVKDAMELKAGVVCAGLVDLIVLDRVEIEIDQKSLLGFKYENSLLKVKSTTPTGTFLDEALFNEMLEHHEKSKPKQVQHYFEKELWTWKSDKSCAYRTLENLVELGILDKEEKFIGKKYPTLNPEPETALVKEIRQVALNEDVSPDSYIRALLMIMRAVDNFFVLSDPLLKRHFSGDEYKDAKDRIKKLVGLGKKKGDK